MLFKASAVRAEASGGYPTVCRLLLAAPSFTEVGVVILVGFAQVAARTARGTARSSCLRLETCQDGRPFTLPRRMA